MPRIKLTTKSICNGSKLFGDIVVTTDWRPVNVVTPMMTLSRIAGEVIISQEPPEGVEKADTGAISHNVGEVVGIDEPGAQGEPEATPPAAKPAGTEPAKKGPKGQKK